MDLPPALMIDDTLVNSDSSLRRMLFIKYTIASRGRHFVVYNREKNEFAMSFGGARLIFPGVPIFLSPAWVPSQRSPQETLTVLAPKKGPLVAPHN